MKRYSLIVMPIFVSIVAIYGCFPAVIDGSLPPPASPDPPHEFRVGASRTDITPMPGYPMAGYAAGGRISRGVWTRLYARAICFEDKQGVSMALVSCDLWSIPGGLADRVAELVSTKYGVVQLGREQIVISATHTHNSPGNYCTSALYNLFASPQQGFDENLFDFLAHRIAAAVAQAWDSRKQAALIRTEKNLAGIARNRSLGAFEENGQAATDLIEENQAASIPECTTPFAADEPKACQAIDPKLTVIRAEPRPLIPGADPIAVMAFYAVHPTVMGSRTQVYSSDVFGMAKTLLEQRYGSSVVAVFNGAEGDVSADWVSRDRPSALKIAELLETGIIDLLNRPGREVTGPIRFKFRRFELDDGAGPMIGASMLAGSEADWSFFRDAGWREGMAEDDPAKQKPGHGTKMNPLSPELIQPEIPLDLSDFLKNIFKVPENAGIGVYGLGQVTIATLPGEFTTILGRKIAKAIADEVGTDERVLFIGLANEYVSYFTTEPEHDAQHYEGASMLYGPASGQRIKQSLVDMSTDLDQTEFRDRPEEYRYSAGLRKKFGVMFAIA